jgi:hypothetical protein
MMVAFSRLAAEESATFCGCAPTAPAARVKAQANTTNERSARLLQRRTITSST